MSLLVRVILRRFSIAYRYDSEVGEMSTESEHRLVVIGRMGPYASR